MSISFVFDESAYNERAAKEVMPFLIRKFSPDSILDVGCGIGTWLKVAADLGVKDICGVDGAFIRKEQLKIRDADFVEWDLREPLKLNRKFDLVVSLEVGEHLPEAAAETLVSSLCSHGDIILFSAAIPGQGGQNHINEQWPDYWAKLFGDFGFYCSDILRPLFWENRNIDFWYRQNMMIYTKNQIKVGEKEISWNALPIVHPGLLIDKLSRVQQLESEVIYLRNRKPGIKKAFRLLLESLSNKLKKRKSN